MIYLFIFHKKQDSQDEMNIVFKLLCALFYECLEFSAEPFVLFKVMNSGIYYSFHFFFDYLAI